MYSNTPLPLSRGEKKHPLKIKNSVELCELCGEKKAQRCTQRPYTIITINYQLSIINYQLNQKLTQKMEQKSLWSKILNILITVLTAIATTFTTTSCIDML